jgi:hypothetical protein
MNIENGCSVDILVLTAVSELSHIKVCERVFKDREVLMYIHCAGKWRLRLGMALRRRSRKSGGFLRRVTHQPQRLVVMLIYSW